MKLNRNFKQIFFGAILFALGIFLVWAFKEGHEQKRPIKQEHRLSIEGNENVIVLDEEAELKSGIKIEALEPQTRQRELKTYAIVAEEENGNLLIEVIIPAGADIATPPQSIWMEDVDGSRISAHLVSEDHFEKQISNQAGIIYSIPQKETKLNLGMGTTAYLPVGPLVKGVIIPSSAIVWWEKKPWVYIQNEPHHFARREVEADFSIEGGLFVSRGVNPGDYIVVTGAETLLSEELRGQIKVGEEDEEKEESERK